MARNVPEPTPIFSVIVPTHQARERIAAVVTALEAQRDAPGFEVVLVDDGSIDGTAEWLERRSWACPHRLLRQRNRGPAAARNAGIAVARGPMLAFLGDDTIPEPGWLAAHAAAHRRAGSPEPIAVVGHTRWHRDLPATRFLRWLESDGKQFGYGLIDDPEHLPYTLLYASNLSIPREVLQRDPFDERFPFAAWEDTELGYRLARRGVRITHAADARAEHVHPTSLTRFCRRQERAGYASLLLYRLHPEHAAMLGLSADGPRPPGSRLAHRLRKLVALGAERLPVSLPGLWERILMHHFDVGLRLAWREQAWLDVGQAASAARSLTANPAGSP